MSDGRQESLNTLIELASTAEDEARIALGQSIAAGRDARQQLDTLTQYRDDYQQRLHENGQNGMTALNYHNFTRFLATLDEAIVQQTKVVEHRQLAIDARTASWQETRQKRHALETLRTRHQQQALVQENRREQRMADEMALQSHRRTQTDKGAP